MRSEYAPFARFDRPYPLGDDQIIQITDEQAVFVGDEEFAERRDWLPAAETTEGQKS